MAVLAIDTALDACAVAVIDADGACLAEATDVIGRGHAERLMPMIDSLLAAARISYQDLTRVIVTIGPGSFTGIRVGVAAARGLALALGIPVVGVTTLDAHHGSVRPRAHDRPIGIFYDARRGEIYGRLYGANGDPISDPFALPAPDAAALMTDDLRGWALAGSGAALVADALVRERAVGEDAPTAFTILDGLAFAPIRAVAALGLIAPVGPPPRPLYIRPPDAKPQDKARIAWA